LAASNWLCVALARVCKVYAFGPIWASSWETRRISGLQSCKMKQLLDDFLQCELEINGERNPSQCVEKCGREMMSRELAKVAKKKSGPFTDEHG